MRPFISHKCKVTEVVERHFKDKFLFYDMVEGDISQSMLVDVFNHIEK